MKKNMCQDSVISMLEQKIKEYFYIKCTRTICIISRIMNRASQFTIPDRAYYGFWQVDTTPTTSAQVRSLGRQTQRHVGCVTRNPGWRLFTSRAVWGRTNQRCPNKDRFGKLGTAPRDAIPHILGDERPKVHSPLGESAAARRPHMADPRALW